MTLAEILAKVELKNPPFPIELRVSSFSPHVEELQVICQVKERDTGEPHRVFFTSLWSIGHERDLMLYHGFDPARLRYEQLDRIRRAIRLAVDHEIDECFLFDGARIFDPHRNQR